MNPDEPACWEWAPPRPLAEILATAEARWPGLSKSALSRVVGDECRAMLDDFHRGRCAICGLHAGRLVDDHDHQTGLIRGLLCPGCNTREGVNDSPIFVAYRERHPAAILGLSLVYRFPDGTPAMPAPPVEVDRWKANPLAGVGL